MTKFSSYPDNPLPTIDPNLIQYEFKISDELLSLENEPGVEFESSLHEPETLYVTAPGDDGYDLLYVNKVIYGNQVKFVLRVNQEGCVFGVVTDRPTHAVDVAKDWIKNEELIAMLNSIRLTVEESATNIMRSISENPDKYVSIGTQEDFEREAQKAREEDERRQIKLNERRERLGLPRK